MPVITACVHVDYTNYDLWPPSVTFVDPCTRQPTSPAVRAPQTEAAGVRDALVDGHPETGRPFLCLPGVREYHQHPQHTGDDWLLHRAAGAGRLAVLCERIWQRMVRNVLGLGLNLQTLPAPMGTQLEVRIAQGLPPPISGPAESTQPVDSSLRSSRGGDGEPAASQEGLNDEQ